VEIASRGIVALQKLRCYNGIMTNDSVRLLTNEQLLTDVAIVAGRERETTARLIELLSEIDSRRLYLGEGYSSLFTFCTHRLHLSEHAAYARIEAARAARKFSIILDLLADGSVTLTTIRLLASHLTADNHEHVLAAARHKSKREVEEQVAVLQPLPPVPSRVRKLPDRPTFAPRAAGLRAVGLDDAQGPTPMRETPEPVVARPVRVAPPAVAALAPDRYKVQLTISGETHGKLRRAQDLLRHVVPNGDPAAIFDRALTLLVADLEGRKLGSVARPRQATGGKAGGRHVPAAIRREVWSRDGGRCTFVGTGGRCTEQGFLEFHHVVPSARGGPTNTANLQLRCRAHNAYQAETDFGPWIVREPQVAYELVPDRAGQEPIEAWFGSVGHLANGKYDPDRWPTHRSCERAASSPTSSRRPPCGRSSIGEDCRRRCPGPYLAETWRCESGEAGAGFVSDSSSTRPRTFSICRRTTGEGSQ
jgi:hypothetical protein